MFCKADRENKANGGNGDKCKKKNHKSMFDATTSSIDIDLIKKIYQDVSNDEIKSSFGN